MLIDIFCKVIDNYGDMGVSWRVAKQLTAEGYQCRLWSNNLQVLALFHSEVDASLSAQRSAGIQIFYWVEESFTLPSNYSIPGCVIEMFACNAPLNYHLWVKNHTKTDMPWLIIDYLSAEKWVESYHLLPSIHQQSGMHKTFFYPGFTESTGGLFAEPKLEQYRDNWLEQNPQWLEKKFHIPRTLLTNYTPTSVFCYPHAPFDALKNYPLLLLLPPSIFPNHTTGSWENAYIYRIPFVSPEEYDYLLWSCELNFVRGEDSFLRAHWAAKPFIWQIYAQENDVHLDKLSAWLETIAAPGYVRAYHYWWNNVSSMREQALKIERVSKKTASAPFTFNDNWLHYQREISKTLLSQKNFITNFNIWLKNRIK